jgi:hypothetical protein
MFFCVFAINFNQCYGHLQAFEYNVLKGKSFEGLTRE